MAAGPARLAAGDQPAPSARPHSYTYSRLYPQKSRLTLWLHPMALGLWHPDHDGDLVLWPAPGSAPGSPLSLVPVHLPRALSKVLFPPFIQLCCTCKQLEPRQSSSCSPFNREGATGPYPDRCWGEEGFPFASVAFGSGLQNSPIACEFYFKLNSCHKF